MSMLNEMVHFSLSEAQTDAPSLYNVSNQLSPGQLQLGNFLYHGSNTVLDRVKIISNGRDNGPNHNIDLIVSFFNLKIYYKNSIIENRIFKTSIPKVL